MRVGLAPMLCSVKGRESGSGLSSLRDGLGVHVLTFQTAAASHVWLNDVIAVGEGTIDVEHGRLTMRYYECGVEAPILDFMG